MRFSYRNREHLVLEEEALGYANIQSRGNSSYRHALNL